MASGQKTRKISALIISGILAVCIGAFVAVRLHTLILRFSGVSIPIWLLWALIFTAVLFLIFKKSAEVLKRFDSFANKPQILSIALISLLFCIFFNNAVVFQPIASSGAAPDSLLYITNVLGAGFLLTVFFIYMLKAVRRGFARLKRLVSSLELKDLIFCILLLAVINTGAWLYIKNSHTIYFWDNAGYWNDTHFLAETARQGIIPLIKTIYTSILTQDYNYLIIVPWIPLVLIFGTSRWVFIAGIVNLALFPVLLLLYVFIRSRCRRAFLTALCVISCFPMLFYTALTGFVDILGIIFVLFAVMLWIKDHNENSPVKFFVIGCLLALSVLLRRWFLFFALSFFIIFILDSVVFRKLAGPFLTAASSFCFSLLFLFQPLVADRLLNNYSAAYSAYSLGIGVDIHYFFYYFGIFVVLIAVIGGVSLCVRKVTRQQGIFLLLQPLLCFFLFTRLQTHGQQHLLLYIPALVCLVSISFSTLSDKIHEHKTIALLLILSALLPFMNPFTVKNRPVTSTEINTYAVLPSYSYVPPVNPNADEIVKIIRFLDQTAGEQGKTAGILASSFILNKDILLNAEASLGYNRISDVDRSYIAWLPEVDSRDNFPGNLYGCDYFLVADPVQVHLGTDNQECIALPALQILAGTGFGKAFAAVGEPFYIGTGSIKVQLYKKDRSLTAEEKNALIDAYEKTKSK